MIAVCASCGIAEVDEIKLKDCDGCDLVRYCSEECREDHNPVHEKACKKRAAELRDELLFKQPESSCYGDCPICCLPLPLDMQKSSMCNSNSCNKVICNGCNIANVIRAMEMRLDHSCAFCRKHATTAKENDKRRMKRVEANDPIALCHEGIDQRRKGNNTRAFEYWTKAAELGDVESHFRLAAMDHDGVGVEKDTGKGTYHLEEAAICGHPTARYLLGRYEWSIGNAERAVKHWIIAATQGDDGSIEALMKAYKGGLVSKEDLASALRAHKAAVDATKSPQRDVAEEYFKDTNSLRTVASRISRHKGSTS